MKTILVVYTNSKLTKSEAQTLKRYAFNVNQKVKVGDRIDTEKYNTPLQVVEILPVCYKYITMSTGELSNKRTANTTQVELRILEVAQQEKHTTKVKGTFLGEDFDGQEFAND